MVCQIIGQVFHVYMCYLLVWKHGMGIEGVGIASSITNLIVYLSLLTYSSMIPEINEAI